MQNQNNEQRAAGIPAIERVPTAARRMGVSVSQAYREVKAGRLGPLVKLGERASGPDRVKTRRESGVGNTWEYKRDRGSGECRNETWHGRHETPEALFRPSLPSSMHRYPIFS